MVRLLGSRLSPHTFLFFTIIFPVFIFLVTPVRAVGENCPELLVNRCQSCHYLTRVCQKIEKKKGKGSWKRSLKNMVRQGAKLSSAERKQLTTCLAKPGEDVLKLCRKE